MIRKAIDLAEKYISNRSAEKEWKLASEGYMPMTPSILKDFEIDIKLAYHTTDLNGLRALKKLQGSKKTVSAFTKGSEGLSQGARTVTEVLVELSGKSNFQAASDFYSALSRNGYKWLRPLMTDKDYVVNNGFTVPMNKLMQEYLGVKDRFGIKTAVNDLDGKGKSQFVKWYMDESKKIITKKLLKQIQDSISKQNHHSFNNDELFLHSIKVEGVHVVQDWNDEMRVEDRHDGWNERRDIIKDMGFKFKGFIKPEEIRKIK